MQNLLSNMPKTFHALRDGLILSTAPSEEHFSKKTYSYSLNGIVLKINLSGANTYESKVCDFKASLKDNTTLLSIINSDIAEENCYQNSNKKVLSIVMHKDFLEQILPQNNKRDKLFDFFQSRENIKLLSHKTIHHKTKIIAQNILSNAYNHDLKELYLHAGVLEILYTEFNDFFTQKEQKGGIIFTSSDKEAIFCAKEILEKNPQNPPTITELSHKVALNEFKLKAGFKRFLHQSPCQFSIAHRLKTAKELLQTSDMSISEIAKKVGYNSPSTFSNTFYKTYKIRPMDLMKTREYYY